ncbi:MAG: hypothetical protein ACREUT_01940 [Steroidobacteraceae bacterium]
MSILTDLFDAQLAVLKSDLAKALVPLIQQKNNLIAANPTILNVIAQAEAIVVEAKAEAPQIMQDEIKALAQWVNIELQALANPPPASAAK